MSILSRRGSHIALAASLVCLASPAFAEQASIKKPMPAKDLHEIVSSDGAMIPMVSSIDPKTGKAVESAPGFAGAGRSLSFGEVDDGLASGKSERKPITGSSDPVWDGIAQPKVVIGTDSRYRINPTTTFPARATVFITRNGSSNTGHCTGWMINANTVATAGHCLHSGGSSGSWYTGLRIWPGKNGSSSPYGYCSVTRTFSVTGWTQSGSSDYDYGAVKINCSIGNTTGWFGFFSTSDASIVTLPSYISGYPGDKSYGEQWRSYDGKVDFVTSTGRRILYQNDTFGGMSGSPVYYNRSGCGYCSMAIHTGGYNSSYNRGTRIVSAVFNNLQSWKAATP